MIVQIGEKVHVITRRGFESEPRRHFVGKVVGATDAAIRVEGYAFVFNVMGRGEFTKRPELRTRLFGFVGDGLVINVISSEVNLEAVEYVVTSDNRLIVTDGAGWQLDINEYSTRR